MPFRALLFSANSETNAAMAAACRNTDIRVSICPDIFTAIEKAKTLAYSCVIADWAAQPEASFLLKRARESTPNSDTLAIAIVDHDPTPAELRDNRLEFLIYRPISTSEAEAVLSKACEKMQPLTAEDLAQSPPEENAAGAATPSFAAAAAAHTQPVQPAPVSSANAPQNEGDSQSSSPDEAVEEEAPSAPRDHAISFGAVCALVLLLAAAFFLWRARATATYLSRTPEGGMQVLKESVAALFYKNATGALPVGAAGSDAQQDAYFSRGPANANAQNPALVVVATEATLAEAAMPLRKAWDFPLPVPTLERHEVAPVHVARAAVPESMRNSPSIAPPVVVTVNPAQMMPVSAPQPQPAVQQFSEPVAVSEDAARAMLVHSVDPAYPSEGLVLKLHGPVVLQARVGRDGSVEDLKIVRGNFVLSRAAIAAVKQWRFQPYILNGHATATQTTITINFSYPPG
jgi:TonB family protein